MFSWLDIVVVTSTLTVAYLGARLGVVRAAALLTGVAAAAILASRQQEIGLLADAPFGETIASLALPAAAFIGAVVAGVILRRVISILFLGWLDRALGGAVGLALAVGMFFVLVEFVAPLAGAQIDDAVADSFLAQTIGQYVPGIVEVLWGEVDGLLGSSPVTRGILSAAGVAG